MHTFDPSRRWRLALLALLSTPLLAAEHTRDPETQRILDADRAPGNWLTHGRTYSEQRFSPLAAINPDTVAQLGLAWSYELKTNRGAEATPLIVDGVMYVTSAWSVVHAIDAKNGTELWVYDPKVDRAMAAHACCDAVNRGAAYFGGKIFAASLDGRLAALEAKTGALVWETLTIDLKQPYTITGAPRAARGLVFIGNGGAEYGVRGYVSAYEVETGTLRWRFYTVPGNPANGPDGAASDSVMAKAAATWHGEWWKHGGGGTAWDALVYDDEFDQLIIGVGNGSPWNREVRSPGGGDNLFLASILAVDVQTGVYKWHYQTTPGDSWDFTATQPIMLADLRIDGAMRKVAMQAPKNGFFYVVDRANGKLISARPFVPMLASAQTPKGDPISWAYEVDLKTGRPIENPEARYLNGSVNVRPNVLGAHNWQPMSFSPLTGLVYFPAAEMSGAFAQDPDFRHHDGFYNLAVVRPFTDDPKARAAMKNGVSGRLLAWDPVAQKEVWRAERRGPWNGGTLSTAGGLVFQGTVDGRFLALDARTGKELWSHDNQAATLAGPVSFEVGGEQYIAVLGGYGTSFFLSSGFLLPSPGTPINARVYAFKLGGQAPRPVIALQRAPTAKPPEIATTPEQYARANLLYSGYCQNCHGRGAITGGVLPDLRRTPRLQDATAWARVVVEGDLLPLGMPKFGSFVSPQDAELIRAYVAKQAAMLYADEQTTPAAQQ